MQRVAKSEKATASIWTLMPSILTLVTGAEERGAALQKIHDSVDILFKEMTLSNVQRCLADIAGQIPSPVVAVEPVETPGGPLEEEPRLAQAVVTALLNLFVSQFLPSSRQLIDLRICIPWHRYVLDEVDFPQRLFEYVDSINWKVEELREFIELRIGWELRNAGRHISATGNVFQSLFESQLKNDHCDPKMSEDSFEYILRHTHHRPRDLQRLARICVLGFAAAKHIDPAEVLAGKRGVRVGGSAIREAIREVSHAQMREVFTEARRRMPDFDQILAGVRGISIPFTTDNLEGRKGVSDVNETIKVLWSSGILGVQIVTSDDNLNNHLRGIYGNEPCRRFDIDRKRLYVWSFFEYNWEGEARELLDRHQSHAKLIVHPRAFEELGIHVTRDHPIGV